MASAADVRFYESIDALVAIDGKHPTDEVELVSSAYCEDAVVATRFRVWTTFQ